MSASRLLTLSAAVVALSVLVASCAKDAGPTGQNPPPPPPPGTPPPAPPPPPSAPGVTLYAAGNITNCEAGDQDEATASTLMRDTSQWKVMVLGDMAAKGFSTDFQNCYNPSWGQFKDRSYPVLGNHEYDWYEVIAGVAPPADTIRRASGAFGYWQGQLGNNGEGGKGGWYAFDYGAWRIIVMNDNWNRCATADNRGYNCAEAVHAGNGSAYFNWVRDELVAAKTANKCTLVAFHSPLYMSSTSPGFTRRSQRQTTWDMLDLNGADVVLNGQEHHYERMAAMHADGTPDPVSGIQSFNIGTGGESVNTEAEVVAIHPESKARAHKYGVLKMSLKATGYTWEFVPADGTPAVDAGSGSCHL